jgi:kinesin family protein 18/19
MHNPDSEYSIQLSYMEIYNETVRDLLSESGSGLMVVEDPSGVQVLNLTSYNVTSL